MKISIISFILLTLIGYQVLSQKKDTVESKKYIITFDQNCNPVAKPYVPDTIDIKYKRAGHTFYNPHSAITLENDSLYFDGYLIFEAHRFKDDKFHYYDWTYYQFDVFILDSLKNINNYSKRCFFNSTFLDYYYADDKEIGYDTGTGRNKDHGEVEITDDLKESFQKFKTFYHKYLNVRNISDDKYFLMEKLTTKLFDITKAVLWKYDSDSISYFVFRCSFYTAILKYDAYYIGKEELIFLRDLHFFLPVSKAIMFKPVEENAMSSAGFTKSIWYPSNMFLY